MATPIKPVPILTGKIAEDFIRRADEVASKPRRPLTPEEMEMVRGFKEMLERSKHFVPSWRR